jgi:hypothetical protein
MAVSKKNNGSRQEHPTYTIGERGVGIVRGGGADWTICQFQRTQLCRAIPCHSRDRRGQTVSGMEEEI